MPTFDGAELIITLDSGVTAVEVQDVYSSWKEWQRQEANIGFPPAFRTIGGDPLAAGLSAGAYYFLRNDLGWRVKPPEEDITIYLTGNLAPEQAALPILMPTLGGFRVLVAGLQPVTQSVGELLGLQQQTLSAIVALASAGVITQDAALLAVKLLRNRTHTDPATGIMTVFDDNGIPLYTAALYEDIAGTTPYGPLSTKINRRDRLQ